MARAGTTLPVGARPRWSLFSRTVAAVLGGYAIASASAVLIGQLVHSLGGMDTAGAVLVGTMPAFAAYTAALVWAFATRSARRAWAGLAGGAVLLLALALLLRWVTGGFA